MPHSNRDGLRIFIKRAYEDAAQGDGYRVLVDRLWPRGRSKERLALDQWARDIAPSTALCEWFGHKPERWEVFQQRYRHELDAEELRGRMRSLLADAKGQPITLVYGAKDEEHNQAIVLRDVLAHFAAESNR
ncbi:DUF488 domain-containing protein [Paraburkholderia terricola]|uniref:Uncharacterized conserved protein YeaO, DUF488 family n=1 Tax=Paraburkholderia terricola TaxID=169427 RepID=A0A1M6IP70_9BURK|nr:MULTISPECIES: DUF488 family protein [Paraburkholderia]SDN53233.1 Uncharacterized conserved protein YeaO, DUF488 family [Paraburkholderia sediminicola]SHJ36261.1 Uncharacterized conserved protein YeaO, DUF488 family [Paraburkholderia terricola]